MKKLIREKFYLTQYDHISLIIVCCLLLIGLYLQFDIATSLGDSWRMIVFAKQLVWVLLGALCFMIIFFQENLADFIHKYSGLFLGLLLLLLGIVLFWGEEYQGARRWLNLYFFTLQPSQLACPILIISYAKNFSINQKYIPTVGFKQFFLHFYPLIFISVLIFTLIMLSNHLSTVLVIGFSLLSVMFIAGFKKRLILSILGSIVLCFCLLIVFGPKFRAGRLTNSMHYNIFCKALGIGTSTIPEEPNQISESITALSKGSILGIGSSKSRAKHLFLSDIKKDYIFTLWGEQFGFVGGFFIIGLFTLLFYRASLISMAKDDLFQKLVIFGFGINIFISSIIHIGVSIAILPTTGLPLPFISLGGTAMVVNLCMLGVILNFSTLKRKIHVKL